MSQETTCEHCGHVPPDHRDDCRISFACEREIVQVRQRFMALTCLPPTPSSLEERLAIVEAEIRKFREFVKIAVSSSYGRAEADLANTVERLRLLQGGFEILMKLNRSSRE